MPTAVAERLAASARLCLCLLALLVLRCVDGQVVAVSSGSVRGVRVDGLGGARDYWAFRGIRYAAPPVGDLRFKAPRPAVPWEGVADATVEGSRCPQVLDGSVVGSEDCLNVNVYTPTLDCPADGYAVIVFFYGGSLSEGSNSNVPYFGPDFLVHNDVVLVLPNYRVGALGFLNLDTRGVPGNAGIKDGLAALRWVRDNAAAFCGDSARVTAMGQSAGAKLVAFMALAEGSRGLFRAAIQMSGTAVSPMAYTERHVERALALAERLGGSGEDAAAAERTLLQADWRALTGQAADMLNSTGWGLNYNPFVASPEGRPADGEEVVLSRDPESLLRDPPVPRVPTLTGVTSAEGISFSHREGRPGGRCIRLACRLSNHRSCLKMSHRHVGRGLPQRGEAGGHGRQPDGAAAVRRRVRRGGDGQGAGRGHHADGRRPGGDRQPGQGQVLPGRGSQRRLPGGTGIRKYPSPNSFSLSLSVCLSLSHPYPHPTRPPCVAAPG
ncbi:hypothetical protein ONE63_010954 [Megalurothrips usitatus]|uniref:Carboxylesterase type B domain-containing protein n=1 Tax=Megalurothrips usitatus TaxID=439358 RepID=A0AAV7XEL7_9NEOP|nr:hypothetical protein ONE63_010954 [Megalurothrips usitatus]